MSEIIFKKKLVYILTDFLIILFCFSLFIGISIIFLFGYLNKALNFGSFLSLLYIFLLMGDTWLIYIILHSSNKILISEDFLVCYSYFSRNKIRWEDVLDIVRIPNTSFFENTSLMPINWDLGYRIFIQINNPKIKFVRFDYPWLFKSAGKEDLYLILMEYWEKKKNQKEALFNNKKNLQKDISRKDVNNERN